MFWISANLRNVGAASHVLPVGAEAEIELAQRATDVRVVKAHYELATHYLDQIYGDEAPRAQ